MDNVSAMPTLALLALSVLAAAPALPDPQPGFLRAFAETRGFVLGRPTHVRPSPDGRAVLFLRSGPRQPTLALYEYTVATGETRELVSPAKLLGGAEEQLSVAERARRERMRIVDRGFTSFALSEDGQLVLLPLSGRVYVFDRAGPHAKVRLGVIPVEGGATVWARWDAERYPYLARVIWKEKKAPLTLVVQTRDQREQAVLAVDVSTGATRALHTEHDEAWVDLDLDLPR